MNFETKPRMNSLIITSSVSDLMAEPTQEAFGRVLGLTDQEVEALAAPSLRL